MSTIRTRALWFVKLFAFCTPLFLQPPVTRPTKEMDREPKRLSETENRGSPAGSPTVNPSNQPKVSHHLPKQANGSSLLSIQAKTNNPPSLTNGNNLLRQPSGKTLPGQANGNQSSTSDHHATITTFHTTPTPTDRKVVQVTEPIRPSPLTHSHFPSQFRAPLTPLLGSSPSGPPLSYQSVYHNLHPQCLTCCVSPSL